MHCSLSFLVLESVLLGLSGSAWFAITSVPSIVHDKNAGYCNSCRFMCNKIWSCNRQLQPSTSDFRFFAGAGASA